MFILAFGALLLTGGNLDFYKQIGRKSPTIERQVRPGDKIILTGKEYLGAIPAARAEGRREAELRGVAWAGGVIDELHIGGAVHGTVDPLFKGLKNSMRDRCKAITGVDPAPRYPVTAKLTALEEGERSQ